MAEHKNEPENNISKSASNRLEGKHQLEEQRNEILNTAERLFLDKGIENTKMIDIAREVGITKVTLYRYFPNKEEIAVKIHIKMLKKMSEILGANINDLSIENTRVVVKNMIEKIDELKSPLRYIGLFDKTYLSVSHDSPSANTAREQVCRYVWGENDISNLFTDFRYHKHIIMLTNAVTCFCEKYALRGELYWNTPDTNGPEILGLFEDMLLLYIDSIAKDSNQ